MYRCACARLCAVETDTQQGYQQSCDHIIPLQQGNLWLTHLQCSQCSKNRELWIRVTSSCRFRHVCRESSNFQVQTVKGTQESWTLFSETATCCTFINMFVTKSMMPWYAHPDSQKSCENELKIILQHKQHHWIIRNVLYEFWKNRELWIMVHHCAKKKKTSTICVANLDRLPWIITSMAHKISNNVETNNIETKMNLQGCIGKHCLHDAGETRPPRKAAVAAAAWHPRTDKRLPENSDWFLDDTRGEDIVLHRRSFKSVNWAIFKTNKSDEHKRIIPQNMMNFAKIPHKSTIHQNH